MNTNPIPQRIAESFAHAFGRPPQPPRLFFAPGRVNLIGEHTDYNGGYVFPCALSLGTYGAARKRDDRIIRLASANINPAVETTADHLVNDPAHSWANCPKAVAAELQKMGFDIGGFDLYLEGDLPNSAGLSSSASVLLLTCVALDKLFNLNLDPVERVKLCQHAENTFMGVNCGIMDQFAVGMGRKNHAILLDCATLDYKLVPLALGDCKLVIANTNKKRGLADSKYNERRSECERALADLQKTTELSSLCDLTVSQFEAMKHTVQDEVCCRRAKHAIYENARTLAAVDALTTGDLAEFGQLMNESHVSLRDLYEVTGDELDALAESAWAADGVLGSRMTGAGFGGCTVSLVQTERCDDFIKTVGASYTARTGLTADFYIAETGDGATEI